jgi:hypothetical protein
MVVYLEEGGQSIREVVYLQGEGLYPDGGLAGASRTSHNPHGGVPGRRRPVWILEVVYLKGEGWSLP